jgi:hypothetical protein
VMLRNNSAMPTDKTFAADGRRDRKTSKMSTPARENRSSRR